ncbi:hypothetical protein WG947_15470 [Pontibacter sp. H259]|uniref:hypothetical protein n=1 Tax=Pontibacter sp. H259 TaxID=3133421 RepID=UPI0030C3DF56
MAKFLLTLFAVIVMCVTADAQKLSIALNYSFVPVRAVEPMPSEIVKPATIVENDKPYPERELLEEAARLRIQARQDAKEYYKPKAVFWGTMGTTILYPVAGLATGTIVSVVPPSINDEHNPNAHLMKEPAYEEAFKKQAHRKRFGNAAAGFGVGIAVLGIVSKVIVGGV